MADPNADLRARLAELQDAVAEKFAGIQARHGARIQCRAGCSDCCRARLSITRVEEEHFRRGVAGLTKVEQRELASRARDPKREMCPALGGDGRCQLYEFRPMICRSYGVPLRHRAAVVIVNPPVIEFCDLNFVDVPVASLSAMDVLEQTELDGRLQAIDDAYCERNGLPKGERIGLAQILASMDPDG